MSKNLSPVAQTEFDNLVHQVFQGSEKTAGIVKTRSGVVGDTYKFRTMGKGMANQKASQADVTPMDVTHSLVTCTLENWLAPEYTDIFDAAEVNFDEKSELAKSIAKALGRRKDQLIIDALIASSPLATIGTNEGGAGTGMNIDKILAAKQLLDDQEVDDENRIMLLSARSMGSLLNDAKLTSADYTSVRALSNGQIDTFAGFKFVFIGARGEGGIKVAANVYDGYAFHMDSVGMAIGMDQKTEVNYVPAKTSWLCNGMLKAGAVAIDNTGIVKVQATETTA